MEEKKKKRVHNNNNTVILNSRACLLFTILSVRLRRRAFWLARSAFSALAQCAT